MARLAGLRLRAEARLLYILAEFKIQKFLYGRLQNQKGDVKVYLFLWVEMLFSPQFVFLQS